MAKQKQNKASDTTMLLDEGNAAHKGLRRFLQAMVHMVQPETVVEVGTGKGTSAICMALAGMAYNTKVYTFDPVRRGQKPRMANYLGRRKGRVAMVFKDAAEATHDDIGNREIDLLFIDAKHTFEDTKRLFKKFSQWMAHGGIMVMHDVAVEDRGAEYGAHRFWKEIREEKAMLPMYPGIGIVWAGTESKPSDEGLKKNVAERVKIEKEKEWGMVGIKPMKHESVYEPPEEPKIQEPEPPPKPKTEPKNNDKPVRGKGGRFVKTKKDE